jgi:hypothetical protein
MLHRDGGQIVVEATGTFDSGGSAKLLKLRYEETGTDDWSSGSLADAGYGGLTWRLRATITRRDSTNVVHSGTLTIDGQIPIVFTATEAATLITTSATLPLATTPLRLYATQTSVVESRVWWRKSEDTD